MIKAEKAQNKESPVGQKQALRAPHDVYVTLTNKCNLRCLHCYGSYNASDTDTDELTGEQWCDIFQDLSKVGVFFVNISGGEPTIHPDFPKIVAFLKKIRLHFILTTNGVFSNKARETIYNAKDTISGLKFSLDGPTPESHGAIRRGADGKIHPFLFHQTLENLRFFSKAGISFTIATVLHSRNAKLIPQMATLIEQLRPTSWFVSTIAPTGRALRHLEIFASDRFLQPESWKKIKTRLMSKNIYVRFIDMPHAEAYSSKKSLYRCPAAAWSCEISADGFVTPCTMSRIEIPKQILKFDNILDIGIQGAWSGKAFRKFRYWKTVGCDGCTLLNHCGRCIPQSIKWFGDPLKPPAFCVTRGELLGLKSLPELRVTLKKRRRCLKREQDYLG